MHAQFCFGRFGLRDEVLELPERFAQQFVFLVLPFLGLLALLLQFGAAFVPVFEQVQLQEHRFAVLEHVFVDFHALAFGAQAFQFSRELGCRLLLVSDHRCEGRRLLLHFVAVFEQECRFGFDGLVQARQMVGRAYVVESVLQGFGGVLQLLASLHLPLLLFCHFLPVLVGFALQDAQSALVPAYLVLHDGKFLVGALNALEEVVAFQHARVFRIDSLLFAQFEEALLLAFQSHVRFVVSAQPLLLGLQSGQALLQALQLRLCQPFGVLHALQLRGVQDAGVASGTTVRSQFLEVEIDAAPDGISGHFRLFFAQFDAFRLFLYALHRFRFWSNLLIFFPKEIHRHSNLSAKVQKK